MQQRHTISNKSFFILSALIIHVFLLLFVTPHGHFTIDEFIYHQMAKNMVERGALDLWNGLSEMPLEALIIGYTVENNGLLYSQYPSLYGFIAYPFYFLFGIHGLFYMSALAGIGATYITYKMAALLFDEKTADISIIILLMGTYFWPYSQDFWPHMLSLFFILMAFYATLLVWKDKTNKKLRTLFLGGMAIGVATGLRYDSMLALPAVAAPFFFSRKWEIRKHIAIALGLLPFLIFLSITSYIKFGTWIPFAYGKIPEDGSAWFSRIALAGLVLGAMVVLAKYIWILSYRLKRTHARYIIFAGIAVISIAAKEHIFILLDGFYQLVVDIRARGAFMDGRSNLAREIREAWEPLAHNGLSGPYRKAVLQDAPILVMAIFPFLLWKKNLGDNKPTLLWLYCIPIIYIPLFSYFSWQGGGYSMRYFIPTLPFLSIITAFILHDLLKNLKATSRNVTIASAAFLAMATLVTFSNSMSVPFRIVVLYITPLLISAATLLLVTYYTLKGKYKNLTIIAVSTSILYGLAITLAHDYLFLIAKKHKDQLQGEVFSKYLQDDSVIFYSHNNQFNNRNFPLGLYSVSTYRDKVRLVNPIRDDFASFKTMISFYNENNIPMYTNLSWWDYKTIQDRKLLDEYTIEPILNGSLWRADPILGKIVRRSAQ